MHFLRVNVMFYDAVNVIHDIITTADPIPYTANFMFDNVRNNKIQQIRRWKINILGSKKKCALFNVAYFEN